MHLVPRTRATFEIEDSDPCIHRDTCPGITHMLDRFYGILYMIPGQLVTLS